MAESFNNLAELYRIMGSYDKAEPLYKRALGIFEKALGPEHPDVATCLNNLAATYESLRSYAEAASLYQRALSIQKKVLGHEHPSLATTLNNLAGLYNSMGSYGETDSLLKQALAIRTKTLGPEHLDVATSLNNLAELYRTMDFYVKAESLYQRALAIFEKALGPEHLDVAKGLNNLAGLWAAMGKIDSTITIVKRVTSLKFNKYHRILPYLSEGRQLDFIKKNPPLTSFWPSLYLQHGTIYHDLGSLASEVLISNKGLAFEVLTTQAQKIKIKDKGSVSLKDSLDDIGARLANLYLSGPKRRNSFEQYKKEIQSLSRIRERLDDELAAKGYSPNLKKSPVTAAHITNSLPEDHALIDFWYFLEYVFPGEKKDLGRWRYLACVIQSNRDAELIDLGEAEPIHKSISELRKSILSVGNIGRLQQQSAEDSTSREILQWGKARGKSARNKENQAVIIADPKFDFTPSQKVASAASSKSFELEFSDRRSREWRQMGFSQLKYTGPEAVAIDSLLKQKGISTKRYLQDQAQESVLKGLVSPQILHISTHGFFLPDQPELRKPKEIGGFSSIGEFDRTPALENPLLRCGLAFAGANHAESVKEGEDGLATAMEIAGLDLQGSDLVTLSACLTGVGELRSGEGVYGLHRSFLLAGAKTVLASLWSVPDLETKDLMVEFYRRYLSDEKMSKSEALRQAQLAVIVQLRKKYGAAHPAYWGAFVCIGEP